MRRLPFILLFFAVAAACPQPSPPPTGPTPAPSPIIDCAEQAIRDTAINILPTVETALITASWEVALVSLVSRFGESAVACAVQHAAGKAAHDAQVAPSDKLSQMRADNGKSWIAKRNVLFK